ncbi:MAG: hypothetical protein FKY71_07725 [Spiribacter salinus]|uniref:Uncharacterized protein n=1 Tax=Spiribacter salinus TaxID=1335746 RepID=A0A540VS87_9GAMM|nr:MAG: hypothetical protein FKY71_07725 [Spiribacter salinus]
MPKKKARAARKKKPAEAHEHLGARVTGYKIDIEAGLNLDLKGGGLRYPAPDDPLYTYRTLLTLYGECIDPDERAGEIYDFLIVGDARAARDHLTVADIQDRDRDGGPKTRLYRGVEIPVYDRPPGITTMFPGGGKRHFQCYLPVPPQLASDMLTALAAGAAPYMAIHEHKVGRKRWIDTLTLQNTHPAEE